MAFSRRYGYDEIHEMNKNIKVQEKIAVSVESDQESKINHYIGLVSLRKYEIYPSDKTYTRFAIQEIIILHGPGSMARTPVSYTHLTLPTIYSV